MQKNGDKRKLRQTAAKENGCRTKVTNHAIAAQEMAVEKWLL